MKSDHENVVENSLIQAAGGLVWRKKLFGIRIAVIHRSRYGDWCLPKGKPEGGETLKETALREVREEIGCSVRVAGFAGTTRHKVNGVMKIVSFWHMEFIAKGTIKDREEVDRVVWLRPRKALQRLDYPEERRLLAMALFEKNLCVFSRFWYGLRPRRNRLASSLEAFRLELERCKDLPGVDEEHSDWKDLAQSLLARAYTALDRKQLDTGWKCLLAAARMEIYGISEEERKARAVAICKEAEDKLKGWRKKATLSSLDCRTDQGPTCSGAERLYYATSLRDEHFTNEYFRMAHLRNQLVILLLVLVSALTAIFTISTPEWFKFSSPPLVSNEENSGQDTAVITEESSVEDPVIMPKDKMFVMGVILFGVMGGAFSAIMSLSNTSTRKRIPEQIVDSYVTLLRPALGAAGALVVYVFISIELFKIPISSNPAFLAIAFAAGFSERLVVRGVKAVTGEE